ncbi:MAG: hypothetical protein KAR11_03640 [Phycisphaerae bacterium]|nr:hypothetical protein [Phycisphaerae bacterium]
MSTKKKSYKKIILSVILFAIGICCGVLSSIDNGTWIMLKANVEFRGESLLALCVLLFSMVGQATNYLGQLAMGGEHFNPWFFWPGQLVFYSFISISILKLGKREKKITTEPVTEQGE